MQTMSTFTNAGWDFTGETANGTDDYWGINRVDNDAYPWLSWQGYSLAPEIPQNVVIEIVGTNIQITWDAVVNANSYIIFASNEPAGTFTDVSNSGTFVGESWSDAITETKKFYYVKASSD